MLAAKTNQTVTEQRLAFPGKARGRTSSVSPYGEPPFPEGKAKGVRRLPLQGKLSAKLTDEVHPVFHA